MYQDEQYEETFTTEPLLPPDDKDITLTCQLCHQYLCCATQTICHHVFCEACLNEYLLFLNECPQCMASIRQKLTFSNKLLDSLVLDYIKTFDSSQLESFNERMEKHNAFKRNSQIGKDKLIKGLEVDILDLNYIWCTGKIVKLFYNNQDGEIETITVCYGPPKKRQNISLPTKRIAVKGSYTSRKQIPHYHRKKIVFQQNQMLLELTEWNKDDQADSRASNHRQ